MKTSVVVLISVRLFCLFPQARHGHFITLIRLLVLESLAHFVKTAKSNTNNPTCSFDYVLCCNGPQTISSNRSCVIQNHQPLNCSLLPYSFHSNLKITLRLRTIGSFFFALNFFLLFWCSRKSDGPNRRCSAMTSLMSTPKRALSSCTV
jgi:hypothetical protein